MSLASAIRMMGTTAKVSMKSDDWLVKKIVKRQADYVAVNRGLPQKAVIKRAAGVKGNLPLRPISAMLELALGTALNNDPDIAAFARGWSTLRYLGIFAKCAQTGALHLDGAALQLIGPNQRRVLSEDLGIGFGILVAKHWCRSRTSELGPIMAIDVDKALRNGTVSNLQLAGRRQPDYLLAYPDPTTPGVTVYDLLETKGTVSTSTALTQLGRAVTQLAGLTVGGQPMTGIAVSTVSNADGFRVLAVDPEEHQIRWKLDKEALERWRRADARPKTDVTKLDVGAEELFAMATNVGNAALAAFSGNHTAAKRWLPNYATGRAIEEDDGVRRRTVFGTFVGAEYVIGIPGTQSRVRLYQGIAEDVATGLRELDASAVMDAQRSFAEADASEIEEVVSPVEESDVTSATAISMDGSMLEISVE